MSAHSNFADWLNDIRNITFTSLQPLVASVLIVCSRRAALLKYVPKVIDTHLLPGLHDHIVETSRCNLNL